MNSVLLFVQIVLLYQVVVGNYQCTPDGYKNFVNEYTSVKKGFQYSEDGSLSGVNIPAADKLDSYIFGDSV